MGVGWSSKSSNKALKVRVGTSRRDKNHCELYLNPHVFPPRVDNSENLQRLQVVRS